MPLPNFAHLQAQPDLLLSWLQSNLLLSGMVQNVGPVGTGGGLTTMTIGAYNGPVHSATNALSGTPMDFYALRNDPNGALSSYVCNYQANDKRSTTIGTNGDFCFTVTLNGCTFAVGPVQAGNTRTVSHVNTGGNTILQRQQTRAAQQSGSLAGVTLLEPATYRRLSDTLKFNATVFGIRTGVAWKFYFQIYVVSNNVATVYGVYPFPE